MNVEFSQGDTGKAVCTADGIPIGRVIAIEDGRAYIVPREGLVDRYGSLLASCWGSNRKLCLDGDHVREITFDEVRLDMTIQTLDLD